LFGHTAFDHFFLSNPVYTLIKQYQTTQTETSTANSALICAFIYIALHMIKFLSADLYPLLRDRNDFIEIHKGLNKLSYRDNRKIKSFKFDEIERFSFDEFTNLKLFLKQGGTHKIKLSEMNFRQSDRAALKVDLDARLNTAPLDFQKSPTQTEENAPTTPA
jgi:hypothetical protein